MPACSSMATSWIASSPRPPGGRSWSSSTRRPILSDVTGIALSRKASGVLLVVEAERTRAPIIEQARKVIETGGGRLLGVILNKRKHHIPGWIYKLL